MTTTAATINPTTQVPVSILGPVARPAVGADGAAVAASGAGPSDTISAKLLKNSPAIDVATAVNQYLFNRRQLDSAVPGQGNISPRYPDFGHLLWHAAYGALSGRKSRTRSEKRIWTG